MKSLKTLIKLQKNYVDDQRMLVGKLQQQLAKIENDIAALEEQQAQQRALVAQNPDMALTYGDYIKHALKAMSLLQRKRRTAQSAVNLALEKLAELFEEQKRYELAEEARIEQEAREEAHRETLAMDEIGSVSFSRKMKK